MSDLIYLDNNATTALDTRVLEAMMPYLTNEFANASSTHRFGLAANEAVKIARQQIADLLESETNEIVFTSGATEAINLAIKGVAEKHSSKGKHIITVSTEHSAVLDTCHYLETKGYEVTYLPVLQDGLIDLKVLKRELRNDTILVSVMFANNETGVIQPIKEIAALAHLHGAFFMTDATQAFGKIKIDVDDLGIDLLTFSAHKIYGPKGVGGLFARQRKPNKIKPEALLHGGGHERGMRSGTLNVPGIVGLGKAAELSRLEMWQNELLIKPLRDYLENALLQIDDTFINGHEQQRLYNTSSICVKGVDADAIIMILGNITISNGSACTAASINASHVLLAMGINEESAFNTLRFSLGRHNTQTDITQAVIVVKEEIVKLRRLVSFR